MIDCFVGNLCELIGDLKQSVEHYGTIPNRDIELPAEATSYIHRLRGLLLLEQYKDIFQDDNLHTRVWRLKTESEHGQRFTPAVLMREFEGILGQAQMALWKRKFAYIPSPNDQYFEQEKLFGERVYNMFEKARRDIKDVGNCYAASLYTACVFHCIRVAEFGLRAMADKLGITISDKNETIPLEYGDWNKVISQINNKISETRRLPNNPTKENLLKRYSEGTERLERTRDIWRNDVCHSRTYFDEPAAKLALVRVRDLMQFLADTLEMEW
jgi:hypothetical protein